MTAEHAWPQWIRTRRAGIVENLQKDIQTGRLRKWSSKDRLGIVTNDICRECNNGWMSDLENAAKNIIRPLMHTSLIVWLSIDDQKLIRRWILKTVMMLEAANPARARYFTDVERESVWIDNFPPQGVVETIGLGTYSGSRHGVYSMMFHRIVEFAKGNLPRKSAHVYTATLQMERFLAQVLWIRGLRGVGPDNFRRDRRWDTYVFPISRPTRGIDWPFTKGITDADLEAFVDRWHIRSMDPEKEEIKISEF